MKHRTGHLVKRGDTYYCRWSVNGRVFLRALRDDTGKAITSKREAEEAKTKLMAPFALAQEAEVLQSMVGKLDGRRTELAKLEDEQHPPLTIAQAWAAFLATGERPDTGPDTLAVYAGQFRQFREWMAEQHPELPALRDVSESVAIEYASHLRALVNSKRLTPNTFNKHTAMLALVFRVLYREAKLTTNPWLHPKKGGRIPRLALTTSNRRELTVDELRNVCQNAPPGEMRTLFALGVYTGLRLYDCATLRWGETDLQRNVITRVPHKISRKPNAKPVLVPIHPALREMLCETAPEARGDYVLPKTASGYTSGGAGKKRIIDAIQDHFISRGVSIYAPGTGPGTKHRAVVQVGFHSLRHSFVSICREADVPLAVVESIVGHSNPAMTRSYTHLSLDASRLAVASLPTLIGDPKASPPKASPESILREARAIAESITAKNWKAQKAAMLALLP